MASTSAVHPLMWDYSETHFTKIPYERFVQRKEDFAEKIQAVFVWGAGALKVDQNLLLSLPNLKAVVNGGI